MCHYYLQKLVNDSDMNEKFIISSCGTYANTGESSTLNAIEAMKKYGVDLNTHRAINIEQIDIENYDLILCLTLSHKASVLEYCPNLKGKVYTLKEYVHPGDSYKNIDDPWGLNLNVYNQCAEEIVREVNALFDILKKEV
jgi:protein-tyrosine phosphatase